MADSVNMSLDEIIKQNQQNRVSRNRGRGGGTVRGRGNRGRGARGGRGGGGRGRSQSRPGTPNNGRARSRSRSRVSRRNQSQTRSQSQQRSRSQPRSRSQQRSFSQQRRFSQAQTRSRSRSRSQLRSMTPKGRAGLEDTQSQMPHLVRRTRGRGGQMRFQRSNSIYNGRGGVHSRLGISTRSMNSTFKPLAVVKRGILKRGRGLTTRNRYSTVGLRSDQILKEQRQNLIQNQIIQSQTFTRSRNNSLRSASELTVCVANDFAKRRRNSVGNAGFLNKQSLAQLNNQYGGYNTRRGPGSVKSVGSNRSNRSNQSNSSRRSQNRGRGRGRGGIHRGVGGKFVNKQMLNPKLQKEIAAIQGKSFGSTTPETPGGINFTPTPAATTQTLHQRFASA